MIRSILAVIGGLAAGFFVIYLLELIGRGIYPSPEGLNMNDPEAVRQHIENAPAGTLLMIILAHFAGTFAAVFASIKTDNGNKMAGYIAGGLLLAGTIANLIMIPHPGWFSVADPLGSILGGFIAIKLIGNKKQA